MFLTIMSKTLSTGLGRVATPLVAALMLVGCGGGGGGGITGVVAESARVVASLTAPGGGSGGGIVLSSTSVGNSASQTSTSFSSQPERDASNANSRVQGAALGSLTPNFQAANTNQLTSPEQGAILLSTGTVNAAVEEGVVDNNVPINQGTDQGRSAGFAFVGGGSSTSTVGRSPTIGQGRQDPDTTASSRLAVSYGKPFAASFSKSARFEYSGGFAWTLRNSFDNLALGQVTISVDIGGETQSFNIRGNSADHNGTGSVNEAGSIVLDLSSGFTFDAQTGRFTIASADIGAASNTNGFRPGTSGGAGALGTAVPIMLIGQFAGADAQAVSGIFATLGETANEYVGAFVADGPLTLDEATVVRLDDGGAVLDRNLYFLGASAATLSHFVTADFSQLYAHINSPRADIVDEGLLAKIGALGSDNGAVFAAGTTPQIVAAGDLRRITTSASYRDRNVAVTSYGDPDGVARLLVVNGSAQPAVGAFLVSGGLAIQAPSGGASFSGTHTYHGAQLVGARDRFQNAQPAAIAIDVNFGTRAFTYRTLNSAAQAVSVAGTATLTTAQLAAGTVTSAAFTVTPRGASAITAEFRGRAGGLWQAISGVFATNTDSGTQYAGGFVAYLHDRATALNATAGIGRIDGINLESGDDGVVAHALFAASDVAALIDPENDLPTRGKGLLSSIKPDLSGLTPVAQGAAAGHTLKLSDRSFSFDSQSVNADIYFDRDRTARLLVLHGADNSPVVSAIVAGGSAFSGTLSGAYTYVGAYLYAEKATAHDTATGSFALVANFAGGSLGAFSLVGTTPAGADESSLVFAHPGASATISGARFSATGGFFKKGSGTADSEDLPVILHGIFSGVGAQAISGVFATNGTGGTQYVGGFVGGGRSDVATWLEPVGGRASGLGVLAQRNLGSGTNGIVVAGDDYAALIAGTAAASDTARDNAFLAGLNPSGFAAAQAVVFADGITTHLEARANTRTGGAHNSGGAFPVTEWTNQGGQTRLLLFDGSGVTGTGARGSFLAAGGAVPPATGVLTGGFTWSGALVLGEADALHGTPEIGRFTLRYDFAGSDTVKGSLEGAFADIPGNGGTTTPATIDVDVLIYAASGTITNSSDGTFELVTGGDTNVTFDGVLAGFASGAAAQGISGVFATNGTSGAQYVGGFVGGAPVLARVLADPANGLRIGTAREGVAGTPAAGRGSLFLGVDAIAFNTHANALNTVSDVARGNALLSNLHATLADGALLPDTGITKYTLSQDKKITYGTSEVTSGVVFGNSEIGLRLVAFDVFIAVGGTLLTDAISGSFEYSGAFVSARRSSGESGESNESAFLEGTFNLVANLAGASDTHYFTLDAQTANAGGTVTTQLNVTQANGATINATTGAFSATEASFIEGAGDTGGIPALVHGHILSAGAGVAGLFTTTQAGTLYAGGFVGNRLVSYPINTYVLSDDEDDIDGTPATGTNSTYGAASGTRYFTLSGTSGVTQSEISILSNTVAGDVSTATAGSDTTQGADLTWLTAALGAISSTATADTARADSTDDDEKTFTTGYSATGVTEYRTNRTTGTAPNVTALDVASLYLVDNGDADRIVVTGPDYVPASKTYLEGLGGQALSYVGRLTAPQLLAGAYGTDHADTHRFTLEIVVAAGGSSATFDIRNTSGTGGVTTPDGVFNIDDGEVDLDSGRLTLGSSSTYTVTHQGGGTPFAPRPAAENVYKPGTGTFGLAGQIYGDKAEAVGGTYWGQALGGTNRAFIAADDGKPFGGAFIASFAGTYLPNVFSLTGTPVDIDGAPVPPATSNSTYGVGIGTRTRKESADSAVDSEIIVITGGASADFSTATDADLPWLSTALETAVTADTGRVDGTGAGQTFTVGYKAADSNVIEYRTNGYVGVSPLQVARLYLINNGDDDRLVVTGPDYNAGASTTSFTLRAGHTSTYTGRIFGAQLLGGVHGVNHEDSGLFTLSILAGTNSATSSFTLDGAYSHASQTNEFRIENGAIDFATGRLTVGSGSAAVTQRPSSGPGARVFKANTFGFVGQLYGSGGEALGGTYWGVGDDAVNRVSATNNGKLFGGAFIASRSALTAPAYPQNVFNLTATEGDIDDYTPSGGSPETGTSTYGVAAGAQFSISASGATPTEASEIIILSNTAAANATTATPASGDANSRGAAIDWIHATITAGAALTATGSNMNIHSSATDYVSGGGVHGIRTSRIDSDSNALDVAAVYIRAYGTGDRLVLAGENYAASSWFGTQSNLTLTYGGALILPTLLADASAVAPTSDDADAFTLTIDVKANAADSSFTIDFSDAVSDSNALLNKFAITGGAIDFTTGRLTVGSGSFTVTTQSQSSGATTDVDVFKGGSLGFIGQIYGTQAESLGGAYWGVADGTAPTVDSADDDKVFGGAFVASRSSIYPQNLFDLATLTDDIDGSSGTGYGSAVGSRYRVAADGATGVTSSVLILSPTAGVDASTATIATPGAPNGVALAWLGTALEAIDSTATADTTRADGDGTAQTFTIAYTGTDVIEYRTNRTGLDVASLYLINNASTDRIVVTGPDYGAQTYLSGQNGMTLSYGGRITAPQLLTGVGGTTHANTHGFTLDIVVATSTSATFNLARTTVGTDVFTIEDGAVDLSTGRLTIGSGTTTTLTEASAALAQATTLGFAGQIYGDTADAVGGTYWGRASDSAATFETADDGKPFGGAFIASRSGIAETIIYPQNLFDLATLTGDIDGSGGTGYGSAVGSRYRVAADGATGVTSSVLILSPTAVADASTATIDTSTAPNGVALAWLGTALEATASATAATGRDDGAGAAQTFTAAYTGTDVIEYRTNRTAGSPAAPLDVASLYLINNAAADRIVVTGPDYGSQSYLSGQGGMTLSYGGRITAPQLLSGVGGTAHANTHGFTLDIVVATAGASATFDIATTTIGTSEFTIDGGAVDLSTGRLTIGTNSATLTESSVALAQATTFGFAGQIYGATADAVGGTYWGRANDSAATFDTGDAGNPFGGAFIASRSGIAETNIYPQNLFDLATVNVDIDGSGGLATYGSATGSRYRVAADGATGVTSSVLILSPTAETDVSTATKATSTAPNGVALAWLGTALEAIDSTVAADTNRADGSDAAQTFTTGYSTTGVIEYRTNRAGLDVASLYLVDNAAADRIVVTGPDYLPASRTYLVGKAGETLNYVGRLTAPQLLAGAFGTAHADTHRFTLGIVVAAGGASATFDIGHTRTDGTVTSVFNIEDGEVDLGTGRLTLGTSSTHTITHKDGSNDVENLYGTGTGAFGLVGQIYGDAAEAVGGTYWGQALGGANHAFSADDNGKPFGGAFIASRAPTPISYPQNLFSLTGTPDDIDGTPASGTNSTYGVGIGTRARTAGAGESAVDSEIIVITGNASADFTAATNADLGWLSTALETVVTVDSDRRDGTASFNQTFSLGYESADSDVIEYRTNGTAGTGLTGAALDVARLYLISNAGADRLAVTGPDYNGSDTTTWFGGRTGNTVTYTGRIIGAHLLSDIHAFANNEQGKFTLDILVAATVAASTFTLEGAYSNANRRNEFTIEAGAIDFTTGRLTLGSASRAAVTQRTNGPGARVFKAGTFGFVGQLYGASADALGGAYWGAGDDAAHRVSAANDGELFGGAFIASRSAITAPAYPQSLFNLRATETDIDDYTDASSASVTGTSTYGVAAGAQFNISAAGEAPTETNEIIILSNTAAADATAATPASGDTTSKGAAVDWIHATIATGAALTTSSGGANFHNSFTDYASGNGVVVVRTNRTDSSSDPLDVAAVYVRAYGTGERLVLAGENYAASSWFGNQNGSTLTYGGALILPTLLADFSRISPTFGGADAFTLTIDVKDTGANSSFTINHSDPVSTSNALLNKFSITDGAIDFTTGRLTVGSGSFSVTTEQVAGTDVDVFKGGSLGFIGQIYGTEAESLGGAYWGVANGTAPTVVAADDDKVYGGAFVASRSGITPTITYPNTFTLSTLDADLHSSDEVAYGLAAGERSRTATQGATAAKSDIVFISPTVATDVSTAGTSTQAWLTSALEATLADDSTRPDGSGANQTHTKGRTATGIIAFETTRGGSDTRMYIVDNSDKDRLLVAGPEYTSKTYLTTTVGGGATESARTLNYTGRATVPEIQINLYNTPPATVKFTATLIMTSSTGAFKLTTDVITGRSGSNRSLLEITADLDVDTGRLTSDDGFLFYNGNETNVRSNTEVFAHEGFAGQVYGNEAQSIGGVFWGVQPDRTKAAGYFTGTFDDNKVFAGAFIGTKD